MTTLTIIAGTSVTALKGKTLGEIFSDTEISALIHFLKSNDLGRECSLKTIVMHAELFPALPAPRLRIVPTTRTNGAA